MSIIKFNEFDQFNKQKNNCTKIWIKKPTGYQDKTHTHLDKIRILDTQIFDLKYGRSESGQR